MSLRDALIDLFHSDDFTHCEFMDNALSGALADAVLTVLREGPWHDGAVERIGALFTLTDEWGNPDPDCARALAEIVLRAALGEDT